MKKNNLIKTLFIATLFLTIYSCQKEKNAEDYYWIETKCADPWNTVENNSDNEIELSVIDYLENKSIKVFDISIKHEQDLMEFCETCTCRNDRRIIVSVDNKNKMKDLGFKKY